MNSECMPELKCLDGQFSFGPAVASVLPIHTADGRCMGHAVLWAQFFSCEPLCGGGSARFQLPV